MIRDAIDRGLLVNTAPEPTAAQLLAMSPAAFIEHEMLMSARRERPYWDFPTRGAWADLAAAIRLYRHGGLGAVDARGRVIAYVSADHPDTQGTLIRELHEAVRRGERDDWWRGNEGEPL